MKVDLQRFRRFFLTFMRIIRKDFRLLFRRRSAILTLILAPMLLIMVVGFAFNNSGAYKVRIGFYFTEYTPLSGDILDSLERTNYRVQMYENKDTCIDSVKLGESNICLIFTENFTVGNQKDNRIDIYVDYSAANIAWMVIDTVSNQVKKTSENVTADLTTVLLQRIDDTNQKIAQNRETIGKIEDLQQKILSSIQDIEDNMDVQNLTIERDKFATDDISSVSSTMQERVGLLVDQVTDSLEFIRDRYDRLNITDEEKEAAFSPIDKALSQAKIRGEQFKGKDQEIQDLIDDFNSYIDTLEKNLNTATAAKKSALIDVRESRKTFMEIDNEIQNMKDALDSLDKGISQITVNNAQSIAVPIKTKINPVTAEKTHLSYLFPALVMMFIMFVGILSSSTLVVIEKKSSAYLRNFITPTKTIIFILAKYSTSMLILSIQLLIIFLFSFLFLGLHIPSDVFGSIIILFLSMTLFTMIGMAIGYSFKSEELSTLAAISVASIFLLLSGIILPLESMQLFFLKFSFLNPFVLSVEVFKKVLLYSFSIGQLSFEMSLLLIYTVLVLIYIVSIHGMIKKKYLTSLFKAK